MDLSFVGLEMLGEKKSIDDVENKRLLYSIIVSNVCYFKRN